MTPSNCLQCGAPLPVSLAPIVGCRFCGREYHNAPRPVPPRPAPSPAVPSSSSTGVALAIVAVFGLALVGAAVAAFLFARGAGSVAVRAVGGGFTMPPTKTVAAGALVRWDYSNIHLFRGNGATPNIIGVGAFADGSSALVSLSGSTGKPLWRSPSGWADIYTDGVARILRYELGKTVTAYEPSSGKVKWTIHLSDDLGGLSFGPRCAQLKLHMSSTLIGIDTETGQSASCAPPEPPTYPPRGDEPIDVTATRGDVSFVGAVRADNKTVNPDPTRLAVTARRGAQKLWEAAPTSLEPVWETGGFDRSLAFTNAGAFVFGRSSSDHAARIALIDLTNGRIVYEKPLPGKVETRVVVASGGDLAFVLHDQRLEAYVAKSGELSWAIRPD